ncbi:MAG: crosslink repair DNA glycosylase YcaQ family protein, partial [Planctomycetota bacterium]
MAPRRLSLSQARRMTLAAQGFNVARPKRVTRQHLLKLMKRINLIQLDSVPVIIRTQYMPGFSRLGPYRAELLDEVAYRDDKWFEAWSHEATLVPVETEPWLRWNKARNEAGETWRVLRRLS